MIERKNGLSSCISWQRGERLSYTYSYGSNSIYGNASVISFFTSTGKLSPTKPGQVSLGTRGAKVLGDMPRLDRFSSGFGVYLILRGAAQNTKVKEECFRRLLVCSS